MSEPSEIEKLKEENLELRNLFAVTGSVLTYPDLPDVKLARELARRKGYALGVHGTLKRDCDLIAAPWTDEAVSPEELIDALCIGLNARVVGPVEEKPLGRMAWCLQVDDWVKTIDISVVPRLDNQQMLRDLHVLSARMENLLYLFDNRNRKNIEGVKAHLAHEYWYIREHLRGIARRHGPWQPLGDYQGDPIR